MDASNDWNDPLPEGYAPEGEVRLCVRVDLSPDGHYADEWLIATTSRLQVVSANGAAPRARLDFPFEEVSEPKLLSLVDGGALEVTREERRVELVRFTSSRTPHLSTACGMLEKWTKQEEMEPPEEELKRCPKCGFPLEKGSRVCPSCSPKTRSLRRLLGLPAPALAEGGRALPHQHRGHGPLAGAAAPAEAPDGRRTPSPRGGGPPPRRPASGCSGCWYWC